MRILFVLPQVPWPPSQGTALRNYHLLAAAASRHQVDVLAFGPAPAVGDEPPPYSASSVPDELRVRCGAVHVVEPPQRTRMDRVRDLGLGWADMERRLWSAEFAVRLDELIARGRYDVVQLEGFEVAGYLLGPAALRREARDASRVLPKLVFDDHNAEYELQRSAARIDAAAPRRWARAAYSAIQARRLQRREALYACAADLCLAVSDEDAVAIERVAPGVRPLVVANGVDCSATHERRPGVRPTILFSGKLDYRPNVDACEWLVREIVPRVQTQVPRVRVVLAGRDASPAVRALAGEAVEVTGYLSDAELAARRAAAWVYVVPMRMGSGVRFKVLEAMAARVPIVSTTLGASGTGVEHGKHALIQDDASSFADAVSGLLRDRLRAEGLADEGRVLAERAHDWRHITPRLLEAYERLVERPASGVSLISTVWNERESAGQLVRSLAAQRRRPDEVVVVDGGSTDGTPGVLRGGLAALGGRVVERPGANISAGRNRAIEAATHEVVLATDAGVELHPAWAERLAAAMDERGAMVAASGFFVSAPRSAWEVALGATTLPDVGEIDPRAFLPSSRSVAFTKGAWRAAGGYPEWLDYCEDLLFDFGLIAAGARPRFVPRAVVRFRPRRSPRAFFLQYYRYARGDGKADLWRKRHAVRYGTYLVGLGLGWRAVRGNAAALGMLLAGGLAYLWGPLVRLSQQAESPAAFLRAAPLVPLARLVGDVAKMAGYPAGIAWRLQRSSGHVQRKPRSAA